MQMQVQVQVQGGTRHSREGSFFFEITFTRYCYYFIIDFDLERSYAGIFGQNKVGQRKATAKKEKKATILFNASD